jgi:hypothetical protein
MMVWPPRWLIGSIREDERFPSGREARKRGAWIRRDSGFGLAILVDDPPLTIPEFARFEPEAVLLRIRPLVVVPFARYRRKHG